MPYINIRLGVHLEQEQRDQLFEHTTMLMNSVMRKRREVTVVHIQESDPNAWSVDAISLSANSPVGAYIDIKVTNGTNTPDEKAEMISRTVGMLNDVVGIMQEACYVVIDDIPANSWGYNGITQATRAASKQKSSMNYMV